MHGEVEPILGLHTKQLIAGIKLFGYSLNAPVSTALAPLPHTWSPLFSKWCANKLWKYISARNFSYFGDSWKLLSKTKNGEHCYARIS